MSVTYTATLPVREETVLVVSGLLYTERRRLGTRAGTRALGCYRQAILVLRWLLDGTRVSQLAADNQISRSTGYAYLHEGITVLAAQAPGLHSVLLAAKIAGYGHLTIDGTLIETDRCRTPGPTPGVDLWWSGKHDNHGGNVQVITAPDGWPLWTSPVRPGREHDTTALREHGEILPLLTDWTDDHLRYWATWATKAKPTRSRWRTRNLRTHAAPTCSSSSTRLTTRSAPSVNAGIPCSRPPSRPYATSAFAPGPSAKSPQQPS
jgi:hypothetical protein